MGGSRSGSTTGCCWDADAGPDSPAHPGYGIAGAAKDRGMAHVVRRDRRRGCGATPSWRGSAGFQRNLTRTVRLTMGPLVGTIRKTRMNP